MTHKQFFLIIYKVLFGLLGFTAIATEIAILVERGLFNPVNFFSYFTILTNVLVFITFIASAIAVAHNINKKLSVVRSAVTVYILLVGIGFSILLSGLSDVTFAAVPWDNAVLHYIIPLAVLVDYIIDRPLKTDFNKALTWLTFPLVYLIYTMMRGALIDWYPYPFLNPQTHGFGLVILTVVGIVGVALLLTWGVVYFARKR